MRDVRFVGGPHYSAWSIFADSAFKPCDLVVGDFAEQLRVRNISTDFVIGKDRTKRACNNRLRHLNSVNSAAPNGAIPTPSPITFTSTRLGQAGVKCEGVGFMFDHNNLVQKSR